MHPDRAMEFGFFGDRGQPAWTTTYVWGVLQIQKEACILKKRFPNHGKSDRMLRT